ncbi:MAG TPA: lipoyl synthase [Dehalococcoidia bacterium]|nr:lipoyl synthase [Dehalococcoidia bacterium]
MVADTRPIERKPEWLKVRFPAGDRYQRLQQLMREQGLHTVCEEARCPNIGECWNAGTATFMILGDVCTRSCGFCAVTTGRPGTIDPLEPLRLANAVRSLGLEYVVITSVNRDDVPSGGAEIFAACIRAIRAHDPAIRTEVLLPDFKGNWDALAEVVGARPFVLNHNIETVPRLYRRVRPQAVYERSLDLIRRAKELAPEMLTKSGFMVGLGETRDELEQTLRDLRAHGCDIVTIGQYLRPTKQHLPVERYYHPDEFAGLRAYGESLGFTHVESGPLVRSSYHAEKQSQPLAHRAVDDAIPLTEVDRG